MKNKAEEKRIVWVDNVKILAIILVALGHLLQSFVKAGIIMQIPALTFFNTFIYTFHVRLFFICSGFLYQKTSVVNSITSYKSNTLKKLIALGVPYLVFSTASFLLKTIFADSVNTQAGGFFESLFISPEPPYWFLFTLIIIFLITPTAENKKQAGVIFAVSAALYTVNLCVLKYVPNSKIYTTYVYITFIYLMWFALGILLASIKIEKIFSPFAIILFIASGILTYFMLTKEINSKALNNALSLSISLLACFGIIGTIGWIFKSNRQNSILGFYAKYTMPVFLMHTIFAAGIRAVLLKIGITNSAVHLIAGLLASFALPVIAQIIMDKIHLDIIIYPLRYIKIGKKKESK